MQVRPEIKVAHTIRGICATADKRASHHLLTNRLTPEVSPSRLSNRQLINVSRGLITVSVLLPACISRVIDSTRRAHQPAGGGTTAGPIPLRLVAASSEAALQIAAPLRRLFARTKQRSVGSPYGDRSLAWCSRTRTINAASAQSGAGDHR
jgi:hypothetical protein